MARTRSVNSGFGFRTGVQGSHAERFADAILVTASRRRGFHMRSAHMSLRRNRI
jgi:hypothetical protein